MRLFAPPRLLVRQTMACCGVLPAYSDRIAGDFHPVPYYPLRQRRKNPHTRRPALLHRRHSESKLIVEKSLYAFNIYHTRRKVKARRSARSGAKNVDFFARIVYTECGVGGNAAGSRLRGRSCCRRRKLNISAFRIFAERAPRKRVRIPYNAVAV